MSPSVQAGTGPVVSIIVVACVSVPVEATVPVPGSPVVGIVVVVAAAPVAPAVVVPSSARVVPPVSVPSVAVSSPGHALIHASDATSIIHRSLRMSLRLVSQTITR
jgi:hypothetical protein